MSRIGMPERVHGHRLLNTGGFTGLVHRPLDAPLGIAAVKVTAGSSFWSSMEEPILGSF
jgi:hypothetical protein